MDFLGQQHKLRNTEVSELRMHSPSSAAQELGVFHRPLAEMAQNRLGNLLLAVQQIYVHGRKSALAK